MTPRGGASRRDIDVDFDDAGRVQLVITGTAECLELLKLIDQVNRSLAYRGQLPVPAATAFVHAARHFLALSQLVPHEEPKLATAARTATSFDTNAAAQALGITPRAVRKRIATGKLPAQRCGRDWRIDRKDLA